MNLNAAKTELVNTLRQQGIADETVLSAIFETPREAFVPAVIVGQSYENVALPIGDGQSISQPYIVALTTEALRLTGSERVLEIGTGSGYQAAILARLAGEVYTIERLPDLQIKAKAALASIGVANVRFLIGDGTLGWPDEAPFDRIVVTAAAPRIPLPLVDQLADGGIMVLPVGKEGGQALVAIHKVGHRLESTKLCSCRFVPLIGEAGWPVPS